METKAENRITIVSPPPMSHRTRQVVAIGAGTAVGFGIATLLHFIWDWTGRTLPVALFAAVNESVWEHVKILAWAYLFWSMAEYYFLRPEPKRYLAARAMGVITVIILTICFFYIYTGVLGSSVAWVDITSAAVWLFVGELVSVRMLNHPQRVENYYIIFAAALCMVIVMLLCFTASPPHIGLFRDPVTGLYGLETQP